MGAGVGSGWGGRRLDGVVEYIGSGVVVGSGIVGSVSLGTLYSGVVYTGSLLDVVPQAESATNIIINITIQILRT